MVLWRRPPSEREVSDTSTVRKHRGSGDGMSAKERDVNTGNPIRREERSQPEIREEQAGLNRVVERSVVALKRVIIVEQRDLSSRAMQEVVRARRFDVNLATPKSVRKLPRALYVKAKAKPAYRFYTLHDKIYRKDVLQEAWSRCRANGGSSGVDGQSFAGIEFKGVKGWLEQLAQELRTKTYRPQAVRRVNIPKADGKTRPLGIPTIKERVAQMAALIVLEAIFEADLTEEQYAYRPKRSAHDAIRKVHEFLNRGYTDVVDADLKGYFDTIPHHELMKSVARRVSDAACNGTYAF